MLKHFLVFSSVLMVCGCSMPRIIVLNDPLDARQHNDLGASYENRQEYDLAIREYERAAKLDDAWALPRYNLGNVHAHLKEWPQAISAYRAALQIDPDMTDAMNNLAWVLIENDEVEEGIATAEQAVAREPVNPFYWDTLAAAYLAAERPIEADRAARQGLEHAPPTDLELSLQEKLISRPE